MAAKVETRGARTRAAVIASARRHFAERGFDGATGAMIAADVGVTEPTIQHHFGSKAGLLAAVIVDWYDDLLVQMQVVLDGVDHPLDRLRAFARWWFEHNAEHIDLLAVFGHEGRSRPDGEVVATFAENNRRVTRAFERLIDDLKRTGQVRADVPTRILRDLFFGAAEHTMLARALAGRPVDLRRAADDIVAVLLHGCSSPAETPPTGLAAVDAKLDEVLTLLRD